MTSIPATSGIYRIVNTVNGKPYIGSAINLCERWRNHRYHLNKGIHRNSKLQRAWDKYGSDTFIFEVIEYVLVPELLTAREQYWLNRYKPFGNNGYNIDRVAGSRLGWKASDASREKMGKGRRGKPGTWLGKNLPLEAREKLRDFHLGLKASDATKQKMSLTRMGHPMTEKACASLLAYNASHMKTYIVTAPDGTEYVVYGVKQFCEKHHLDHRQLVGVAKGKFRQHKGWKARFSETEAG